MYRRVSSSMSRPMVVTVAATARQGSSPLDTPVKPYTELHTTLMAACCLSSSTASSGAAVGMRARMALRMASQSRNSTLSRLSRTCARTKWSARPPTSNVA